MVERSLGKLVLAGFAAAFLVAGAGATEAPLQQLKSVSLLPSLNLASLQKGEIVVERGPVGNFPRGVQLQSCYFIHAPLSVVGDALLHWNPVQQKDPDVFQYREYHFPGSAADFKTLRLNPARADDQWLLEQTARVGKGAPAGDLHLTQEETELLRQK